MGILEGKTRAERNKTIAAIVLGIIAVITLTWAFGGMLLPSRGPATPPVAEDTSPSPGDDGQAAGQPISDQPVNLENINSEYIVTPVVYTGGRVDAPISGRNIFAFYEPPPFTPTPEPIPTFTPPPTPQPAPMLLSFVTPTTTYAGSKQFRMEAIGDKFVENARIIFSGNVLQTTYVSPQRLVAEVPASLITRSGAASVMVNTPDGSLYSYPVSFNVIEPPKPDFEYIGLIARQHYNNDTAYFQDRGRTNQDPFTARLNDVVKGRFRVISISSRAVEFEDVRLGFKHRLELLRPDGGSGTSTSGGFNQPARDVPSPNPAGFPPNIRIAPQTNRPTREDLNRAIEELQKRRQQQQDQKVEDDIEIPEVPVEPEPVDDEPPQR
ncbi:MAG: hypothetical protein IPM63_15730 [Acidobacteriota bacterium]|nr:MAG: hypothetical protein IPM63_15730 [Acidobacteriota bacterium]